MVCDNDLSNAEYRIALWMAGDTERLTVLATGGDPYIYNAIAMGAATWVYKENTPARTPEL